jgi:uncharacterized protein (DUF427 family)
MSAQPDTRPVKIPGPDHPITIEDNASRVRVWFDGHLVADTRDAVTLREANYAPVEYIPLADVDPAALTPSDHESYCPYKGQASYYDLGPEHENAVWEYREPYPSVARIKDRVAFYPNRVEKIEQLDAE